jgi:acetyl-CoA synthetase (ADP-forming)
MEIIDKALTEGRNVLSEYESKQFLAAYGIPATREILITQGKDLAAAAREIGWPIVMKGCSPDLSHKTEKGAVRIDVRNQREAERAYDEIIASIDSDNGAVLVQELVRGKRELMVGLTRDPQFGPCVMFGLGGIFTEILEDVCFRLAPLQERDALEMMQDIKGHKILDAVRGMPAVDRASLARILIAVGQIGLDHERVKEIDINPLIIRDTSPVAADALVVLG